MTPPMTTARRRAGAYACAWACAALLAVAHAHAQSTATTAAAACCTGNKQLTAAAGYGARTGHAVVSVTDSSNPLLPNGIYVAGGGFVDGGDANDLWFSPDGSTWSLRATLPVARSNCALYFHLNKLWLIGGGASGQGTTAYVFDGSGGAAGTFTLAATNIFGTQPDHTTFGGYARVPPSAANPTGLLVWYGGMHDLFTTNAVYTSADGVTWTAAPNPPAQALTSASCAFVPALSPSQPMIVCVGGRKIFGSGKYISYTTDLVSAASWTTVSTGVPLSSTKTTAVAFGAQLYVIGGDGDGFSSEIWRSAAPDAAESYVRVATTAPWGAGLRPAVATANAVVVLGGVASDASYRTDVWRYVCATECACCGAPNTLVAGAVPFGNRTAAGVVSVTDSTNALLPNGIYVVGGLSGGPDGAGQTEHNDIWHSADGGATWTPKGIIAPPTEPTRRFAAVYFHRNTLWQVGGRALNAADNNGVRIYAFDGTSSAGVLVSSNGFGAAYAVSGGGYTRVPPSPAYPDGLLVHFSGLRTTGDVHTGVHVSTDGVVWTAATSSLATPHYFASCSYGAFSGVSPAQGMVVCSGGIGAGSSSRVNFVSYNTAADMSAWTTLSSGVTWSGRATSSAVWNGALYVFGGDSYPTFYSDVWRTTNPTAANSWTLVSDLTTPWGVGSRPAVVTGGCGSAKALVLLGGQYAAAPIRYRQSVWRFACDNVCPAALSPDFTTFGAVADGGFEAPQCYTPGRCAPEKWTISAGDNALIANATAFAGDFWAPQGVQVAVLQTDNSGYFQQTLQIPPANAGGGSVAYVLQFWAARIGATGNSAYTPQMRVTASDATNALLTPAVIVGDSSNPWPLGFTAQNQQKRFRMYQTAPFTPAASSTVTIRFAAYSGVSATVSVAVDHVQLLLADSATASGALAVPNGGFESASSSCSYLGCNYPLPATWNAYSVGSTGGSIMLNKYDGAFSPPYIPAGTYTLITQHEGGRPAAATPRVWQNVTLPAGAYQLQLHMYTRWNDGTNPYYALTQFNAHVDGVKYGPFMPRVKQAFAFWHFQTPVFTRATADTVSVMLECEARDAADVTRDWTCMYDAVQLLPAACTSGPCGANGQCVERVGVGAGYQCVCRAGYSGALCDTPSP